MVFIKRVLSLLFTVLLLVSLPEAKSFAVDEKSDISIDDEALKGYYDEYLHKSGQSYYETFAVYLWKYETYIIFLAGRNECSPASHTEIIDNYLVTADNIYYPDSLGLYVYDKENIYTLKQAVEKGCFRMADIADLSGMFRLLFDVVHDNKLNMDDVVTLQRIAADLETAPSFDRISFNRLLNYNTCLEAVVIIQRYCAGLIDDLASFSSHAPEYIMEG